MLWRFRLNKIDITNPSISLPQFPSAFDGYRLVHISDFHLGTWLNIDAMLGIVELVNQQDADMIAITGDFISFNAQGYKSDLGRILSGFSSRDGVIAVLGNHDHYTDAGLIREVLGKNKIIELQNSVHVLTRNSSRLIFAGVDDYMTNHSSLSSIINQLPPGDNPVILLAHEPDFADISAASNRFAMQLSGHTHGGQICLPHLGNLYLPRFGRKYPSGQYQVKDMVLYTNRGLGTSWLKFRYNCPPEITVFQLHTTRDSSN